MVIWWLVAREGMRCCTTEGRRFVMERFCTEYLICWFRSADLPALQSAAVCAPARHSHQVLHRSVESSISSNVSSFFDSAGLAAGHSLKHVAALGALHNGL